MSTERYKPTESPFSQQFANLRRELQALGERQKVVKSKISVWNTAEDLTRQGKVPDSLDLDITVINDPKGSAGEQEAVVLNIFRDNSKEPPALRRIVVLSSGNRIALPGTEDEDYNNYEIEIIGALKKHAKQDKK